MVPDYQRQRSRASCDRCKTRKVRCIRLPHAAPSEPCAGCAQLNLACESTLPRKKRTTLEPERYRALEDLARRLFPTEALATPQDIHDLVERTLSSDYPGPSRTIPEGRLIPSIHGVYHYVGPSSSYMFANTIRVLVSKAVGQFDPFQQTDSVRHHRAAQFSSHNRTSALDAHLQGHPNTSVTDDQAVEAIDLSPGGVPLTTLSAGSLPDRPIADMLVNTFFDRVHPNCIVFHRPTFQSLYEDLWRQVSTGTISNRPTDAGWLCSLFLVFVLSAQALGSDRLANADEIQRRYLSGVLRERLAYLLVTSSLANVQCLMLLALYQHNVGERNTAWIITGQATRMAIALGMQRLSEAETFDMIERTQRQQVWWTLHLFEQTLCFVLGRPGSTDSIEVTASLPSDAVDAPACLLERNVSLAKIALHIKRLVACISPLYDQPDLMVREIESANVLLAKLDQWEKALPPHLSMHAPTLLPMHQRAITLLHIQHQHLRAAVSRPFLLALVNGQVAQHLAFPDPEVRQLSLACLTSAHQTCQHLLSLASQQLIEGEVWLDFFYAHHSALILCLGSLYNLVPGSNGFLDLTLESQYRSTVLNILELGMRTRLAPTYRILMGVTMQLAKIVGILPGGDLPTRPTTPRPEHSENVQLEAPPFPPVVTDPFANMPPPIFDWTSEAPCNDTLPSQGLSLERLLGLDGPFTGNADNHQDMDPFFDLFRMPEANLM